MLLLKIRGLNRTIFSLPVSFNGINAFFTYAEVKDSIGYSQEENYLTVTLTVLLVPVISF